ncbi:MAG: FAD-dependent oxidoreductase [Firmicutes bacterium]|nr:FAD-dependent oxidoreductase [Bacillota bacterium]
MRRRWRIVVLGARFAGLTVMHWVRRLARAQEVSGVIVDSWPFMTYRPALVYAMTAPPTFVRHWRIDVPAAARRAHFEFLEDRAVAVDPQRQVVHLARHRPIAYDVLFLATGADPGWHAIEGLDVARGGLCEDYLARATAQTLRGWTGGAIVFAVGPLYGRFQDGVPLATADEFMLYEACLLFEGTLPPPVRQKTDIWLVTPAPVIGEALGPKGRQRLADIMRARRIRVVTHAVYRRVDPGGLQLSTGYLPAKAMVWVPPYLGSSLARASRLDDGAGWVPVNRYLQHPEWPRIYAVGDVTTHLPKLAHSAMVQARVAAHHWWAEATGRALPPPYHPEVLCLIDIGRGQGFFALSSTLYGEGRDQVYVGPLAQWAKRCFNRAYVWGRGSLMVMP